MDINKILEDFFPDYIRKKKYVLDPERREQYKKVVSSEDLHIFDEFCSDVSNSFEAIQRDYFKRLSDDLINNNLIFENLKKILSIEMISSEEGSTCCFNYNDNHIILFDESTMRLIWMLNKVYFYGEDLDNKNKVVLYTEILLQYLAPQRYNFRIKTPAHKDQHSFVNLIVATEIQESFMLAHEFGHIALNKELAVKNNIGFVDNFTKIMNFDIDPDFRNIICYELEADRIAFFSVLNTYKKRDKIFNVKDSEQLTFCIVTSAIFMLIRYNIWMSLLEQEIHRQENTFDIWFLRNSFFRKLVDENYIWNTPTYIIELLNTLEDTFEVAVQATFEILKKNNDQTTN